MNNKTIPVTSPLLPPLEEFIPTWKRSGRAVS